MREREMKGGSEGGREELKYGGRYGRKGGGR